MALGHTARMDAPASAASRTPVRATARGTAGFAAALDATRGAEAKPKAERPPETAAEHRTAKPEPAAARPTEARRETRPDAPKPAGRPAAARSPDGKVRAGTAETVETATQENESPAGTAAAPQAAAAQPAPRAGTVPDDGTVARLAGLVLDEAGADTAETDNETSASEAAAPAPGAVPILPILAVLTDPTPAPAAATGTAATAGIQGAGSPISGPSSGPVPGAAAMPTDAGGAQPAAGVADGTQARAVASLPGEGRAERGERAGEVAAAGDGSAPAEAKPDDLAALGNAAPGLAPPPEAPKTNHLQAAAAAQQAAPTQTAAPPVPIGQVPMTIGLRSLAGSSQFEIRLDPVDLGRIDVTLEINKERGTVSTHLVVERIDTLAMLQRDAGSLQQALSQAGLDASADGGIRLSLRGDGTSQDQAQGQARGDMGGQDGRGRRGGWAGETPEAVEIAPLRTLRGLGSLDIRI